MSTAVPDGPRPTSVFIPGGLPPATWWPASGEFQTHWDFDLTMAMAIPGYWRGRQLISQAIGGMPLAGWDGPVQVTRRGTEMLAEPNPGEDRCTTVAAWVGDLIDHGNAVGIVDGSRPGDYVTITPWPAVSTGVSEDGSTYVFYRGGREVARRGKEGVFHAKGVLPYPGAARGMGVLEAGTTTMTRMRSEAEYATKAFASGTPSGLLRVKDPDLQAGDPADEPGYATAAGIKKQWKANIAAGDIAVLSELVDFQPLGWSPTDAQMIEARQMSLVDVANLLNLDPYWCGGSQISAPYQNVQDAALQLARFTLSVWINPLESQFSRFLGPMVQARFNRDTILRDTASVRVANWVQLLNAGVVDEAYVRAQEGIPEDAAPPAQPEPSGVSLFPVPDLQPAEEASA